MIRLSTLLLVLLPFAIVGAFFVGYELYYFFRDFKLFRRQLKNDKFK